MAEQHQGIIQATINNELYEIRMFRSQVAPRTQIFIIRDQDREVLVNKKLKQAQRLYEKKPAGPDDLYEKHWRCAERTCTVPGGERG